MSLITKEVSGEGRFVETTTDGLKKSVDGISRLSFSAVTLRGHADVLFKKHLSFREAHLSMDNPILSKPFTLSSVCKIKTENIQREMERIVPLATEFITSLEFDSSVEHDEESSDRPFLKKVLRFSAGLDPVSIEELKLEYGTNKCVVGGAFDIVIGCKSNGRKPRVTVHNNYECKHLSIFLGSLLESKSSATALCRADTSQQLALKSMIQPILETMAMSEMAEFPSVRIPLVNFCANKYEYRPLIYFPHFDVLLISTSSINLCVGDNKKLSTDGLVLLLLLKNICNNDLLRFSVSSLRNLAETGWKDAKEKGVADYSDSILQFNKPRSFNKRDHSVIHAIHLDSDTEDSDTEKRPKLFKPSS